MNHSRALCFTALLFSLATPAFAADANSPADFTLGTHVVSQAPPRFGSNLRDPAQYNNFTLDPGFEQLTIKRQGTATSGGTDYIENVPSSGPVFSPGTSQFSLLADGFFDGAHVRIYRPSTSGGALTLVREATVANYITNGWRRLTVLPVTASQFTDTTATPGVTYEYQVRAVTTSRIVSTNYNYNTNDSFVTGSALAGTTSATNSVFGNSFIGTSNTTPAVPANVTTASLPGAVFLDWSDNTETSLAGYYVYRRPAGLAQNRIILDSTGPAVQTGDIYFLEMTVDNAPSDRIHDRLGGLSLVDQWNFRGGANFPYGLPGSVVRDPSTSAPENGGHSSLRLTNPGTHEVSVRQPRFSSPNFFNGFYPNLTPGVRYRVDAWMKQTGIPTGNVRFSMNAHYSAVAQTWTVGANWQKYTFTFLAPPLPTTQSLAEMSIAFTGPGTLWLDNVLLYEDDDNDPLTHPAFELNPAPMQSLADFRPGVLRIWTGVDTEMWGLTLDDWTNPEPMIQTHWYGQNGRSIPDDPYKLPMALKLCRDTGADPWLIVGTFFTEAEWPALIEYLAAPYDPLIDTPATKPWAAKRHAQGQTAPWTDVFPKLYLEFGNETWNGTYQWTFSGNHAGQFAEYFFSKAKASPYFAAVSGKVRFIVDGWDISTGQTSGYGHAAALAAPTAHFADLANYLGGWESGISLGGGFISDIGYQDYMLFPPTYTRYYAHQQLAARDANAAAGRVYDLAVYEEGPGYALPGPGIPYDAVTEAYGKSLAGGVATLDTFLYNSLRRIDPQCYFSFAPGYYWTSHSSTTTGFHPHPSWQVLQMRNRYASGDMVSVATHRVPTFDVAARINGNTGATVIPAAPNTPLIAVYPFRDGTRYSVIVLSRKLSGDTPVTLRLPFNAITGGTIHKLTGNPRSTNFNGLTVVETEEPIGAFSQAYSFTMPAGSVYVLEFLGANVTPVTSPSVTISRGIGQADPTTSPAAQFAIDFSEPVTGFTVSDLQVTGTALTGATPGIVLAQGTPFLGTNYIATISNFSQSGDVTLNLAAGVANAVDDGAPSLAPTILDNTIAFAFPTPQNLLLAYDDFNVAPVTSPQILQGLTTGSGWSQAWQVQNYSASYTDGYKLGTTAPPVASNLRTFGNYAIGGLGYTVAFRGLNTTSFQHFAALGSSPAAVGQNGTTLWASFILSKDTNDNAPIRVDFVNADGLAEYPRLDIGAGFYGGTNSSSGGVRFWTLAVLRDPSNQANPTIDYVRSNVPVVIGQPALLVLKMTFGTTDRVDLFVNPSGLGGAAPSTPNATFTTSGAQDLLFRSVRFRAGLGYDFTSDATNNGLNKGTFDELRFGDTFAAVTPALTAREAWRQQYFGSWQNAGTALDSADPDGDGLPSGIEYGVGSHPGQSTPAAGPQSTIATDRLRLTFPRNQAATDLTWIVEGSSNLSAWTALATRIGTAAWSTSNGGAVTETGGIAVVTDGLLLAPGERRFMRLRVTSDGTTYQTTVPEGALNLRLAQGTTTAIGAPLLNPAVFRGAASGVTATALSTTGVSWSVNQFAQVGAPHFVSIVSGAQAGRSALITGNLANALTLQVDDTNLDAAGFSMAVGDRFEIVPGETLATMFGDLANGLALQGGGAFTADTVQMHNGARWNAWYFDTAKGFWAQVGGNGTTQNNLVLMPERGLLITRRGPATSLAFSGRVPAGSLFTRLPGGTLSAVAARFPVDRTLAQMTFTGPGAWISHDTAASADSISLFNGIRWTAYWRRATDGQWRQVNGDNSDQGGLVIPAGSSVLIQKRGTGTGAASFLNQALPYVLEP